MFIKIFMRIRICLILVIIQKILVIIQEDFYPVNKKVIGKMKDEIKGMYSLIDVDGKKNEKTKRVKKRG